VHLFLFDAYSLRVRQALEGRAADGPLSPGLYDRLAAMDDQARYRADKLRRFSRVLEPAERVHEFREATLRSYVDELQRTLAELALLALIGQSLRGLRRLGLRAEADHLLDRLGEWVVPGGDVAAARRRRPQAWPATLRRLLALAGGWFYVGRDGPATAALDE